ncbi:tRNA adenosine(34) deaminase TadA [Pusillimonas sp. DMV24BSW_D]|uniref:tRNA adenosine(34) deaminase TadA n=1 Tax=Neopusillimonas aestuarii TaxID=2716226 RepID=UPI00140A3DF2|nr:tRNA adenosine(34) deaminase TadA [Pusillimonas sp. DMV24BSW_D]QIM49763.1 tRNA adenosine(34) deaminase TadA [Pusillimonas sp. DMV24BSW_D]
MIEPESHETALTTRDAAAMALALDQAKRAIELGEIPVGAVVLDEQGRVLGAGHNRTIIDHDPTAHAEIVALREAAKEQENYRLPGLRVYVTLEPCVMCMGALMHARVAEVIFGASDPKTGACGSVLDISTFRQLNHHTQVRGGVMADACGALLSDFFRDRRAQARAQREQLKR